VGEENLVSIGVVEGLVSGGALGKTILAEIEKEKDNGPRKNNDREDHRKNYLCRGSATHLERGVIISLGALGRDQGKSVVPQNAFALQISSRNTTPMAGRRTKASSAIGVFCTVNGVVCKCKEGQEEEREDKFHRGSQLVREFTVTQRLVPP